jgi:hypothetical protein
MPLEMLQDLTGLPDKNIEDALTMARVINQHTAKVATLMEATVGTMALSAALVTAHHLRNCVLNLQLSGNPHASQELYESFWELLEALTQGGAGGIEGSTIDGPAR